MPGDPLPYTIDEWSDDGKRFVRYHARAAQWDVAVEAFEAAKRVEPNAHLTLRLGAQVFQERPHVPWKP